MRYILGIDIGTSGTKSVLLDERGGVAAVGHQAYDFDTPRPGWAEQDPEVWWDAVNTTIRQILTASRIDPAAIRGIGFSGQMHGPVFLDDAGRSLRPAIIWADQRSEQECRDIYEMMGVAGLHRTVGNPVDSGFMVATLLWIKRHEPETYRRIYTLLLPKDYVKFRLTGIRVTDPSDAGGTSLYDVRQLAWSQEMLAALDFSSAMFPEIRPSGEMIGAVTPEAAAATGLQAGTPVVNGGNDQTMGALASGVITPGDVLLMIGTGGTLFTTVDAVVVDPGLRMHTYPHCIPGKWHLLGAILAGGLPLKWFRNLVSPDAPLSYNDMTQEAATVPPCSEGVIFLPYLAGERTPHMNRAARGVFFGLSHTHTRGHLTRAIMEGVMFAMRDCVELFKELGVRPTRIIAGGGGASSQLWRQIQADILQLPVITAQTPEKSATGAAMIAGVGAGVFASFEDACQRMVTFGEELAPIAANAPRYEETYQIYRALYPSLQPHFARMAAHL